ncbi:hypothetical protein AB1Y20_015788 [Prymnesium parvum]|uniref:Anaphase-promoting complex subunit 1 n=1 Tax=Prymnesium parvum TaxID=97485 RepID=A0AB34JZJ1_PRYPA
MAAKLRGRVRELLVDEEGASLCILFDGAEAEAELHDLRGLPRPPSLLPHVAAAAFVRPADDDASAAFALHGGAAGWLCAALRHGARPAITLHEAKPSRDRPPPSRCAVDLPAAAAPRAWLRAHGALLCVAGGAADALLYHVRSAHSPPAFLAKLAAPPPPCLRAAMLLCEAHLLFGAAGGVHATHVRADEERAAARAAGAPARAANPHLALLFASGLPATAANPHAAAHAPRRRLRGAMLRLCALEAHDVVDTLLPVGGRPLVLCASAAGHHLLLDASPPAPLLALRTPLAAPRLLAAPHADALFAVDAHHALLRLPLDAALAAAARRVGRPAGDGVAATRSTRRRCRLPRSSRP